MSIVTRILQTSKVGVLGNVEAFGSLVLAEYCRNGVQVMIRVALQPSISISISGSVTDKPEALEAMLESAESTAALLRSAFELIQVEAPKKVA